MWSPAVLARAILRSGPECLGWATTSGPAIQWKEQRREQSRCVLDFGEGRISVATYDLVHDGLQCRDTTIVGKNSDRLCFGSGDSIFSLRDIMFFSCILIDLQWTVLLI